MDRIFCIQQSWHDNVRFPDAPMMEWALRRWCPYYLDKWQVVPDDFEPVREIDGCFAVPVGSIQFARAWLEALDAADPAMTPLELPSSLHWLSGRQYFQCLGKDIAPEYLDTAKWFLKDVSELKSWTSLLYDDMDVSYYISPDKMYSISEKLDIVSEYRILILEGEVLACQNYAGDPLAFPQAPAPGFMVDWYEKNQTHHPRAYSFDIGVVEPKSYGGLLETVPLEIHPLVACGLYGFTGREIPDMLEAGYRWYLDECVPEELDLTGKSCKMPSETP